MTDKPTKTALPFEEKITVAWAHYVKGYPQHDLAAIYNVNAGRVAEACTAIRDAVKGRGK